MMPNLCIWSHLSCSYSHRGARMQDFITSWTSFALSLFYSSDIQDVCPNVYRHINTISQYLSGGFCPSLGTMTFPFLIIVDTVLDSPQLRGGGPSCCSHVMKCDCSRPWCGNVLFERTIWENVIPKKFLEEVVSHEWSFCLITVTESDSTV